MKIAYCSDLHLEFEDICLDNAAKADVLVLAGDIMVVDPLHRHPPHRYAHKAPKALGPVQVLAQRFMAFLARVNAAFPKTVMVMGNHEFYGGRFHASIDHWREELANYPNIVALEADGVEIDGVRFIGGTLWSDHDRCNPITQYVLERRMQDFRLIRNDLEGYSRLRAPSVFNRHVRTLATFKELLAEDQGRTVMVTHHAPSFQSIDRRRYADSDINGGYASALIDFILDHPQLRLAIHGHIHSSSDYMIDQCRVVANPRGYAGHEQIAEHFHLAVVEI